MRKHSLPLILFAAFLLSACTSLETFIPTPAPSATSSLTPTATQTFTPTPSPTRTITPTLPKPATLIVAESTSTPFIFGNVSGFPTTIPFPTSAVPIGGFELITITKGKIFYDLCQPNYTNFTIKVENPDEIVKVYLFFRLESIKKPGDATKWYGTVTDNDGNGYFVYTLRAKNIPERRNFLKAWVQYQFVGEDPDKEIVGRTQIYTRNLMLEACR